MILPVDPAEVGISDLAIEPSVFVGLELQLLAAGAPPYPVPLSDRELPGIAHEPELAVARDIIDALKSNSGRRRPTRSHCPPP
jgi:hypothetical protein